MTAKYLFLATLIGMPFSHALAHGDVTPQAVNTEGLPAIGEQWLDENPWRNPENEYWTRSIEIGASGYNQNCARCHGLEVVSGGLAPDLRYLSADFDGDEWYLERFRHGMTQNGITKMPAFEGLLSQEAAWAIRSFIETRADDGALDDFQPRLVEIRDTLQAHADAIAEGGDASEYGAEDEALVGELMEINNSVETGSGALRAETIALRAANLLDGSAESYGKAAEILTIGLSAAK